MEDPEARTRYALRASLDLARNGSQDAPAKIRDVAARTRTPPKYLVHILLRLKRRALVNSTRGAKGGYWLLRPPERITVAEIVEAVEKDGRRPPREAEVPSDVTINRVWESVRRSRREYLASITLADLLDQVPSE